MPAESGSAAGIAFFKLYGFKVGIGMIGAAMLYMAFPPVKPDGTYDRREFVLRLAAAGLFSALFGDLAIEILKRLPYVKVIAWDDFKAAIYLSVGAPGWWISRAVAIYFHNRRDRDIKQIVDEVRQK